MSGKRIEKMAPPFWFTMVAWGKGTRFMGPHTFAPASQLIPSEISSQFPDPKIGDKMGKFKAVRHYLNCSACPPPVSRHFFTP
jgi:hypothetical protein